MIAHKKERQLSKRIEHHCGLVGIILTGKILQVLEAIGDRAKTQQPNGRNDIARLGRTEHAVNQM